MLKFAILGSAFAGDDAPVTVIIPPLLVTPDNFVRAESDLVFSGSVKDGAFGKLLHHRELVGPGFYVIRPNRDTLYSHGVFDLDAGPVTITLPNPGDRFLSLQVVDEDHYTALVSYGAGVHTFTREEIGTRYVSIGVRILLDPNQRKDVKRVHALQDDIRVEQPGGPGTFSVPTWDSASQDKVRRALLVLNETLTDSRRMFGARDEVDPVRHLIGTAMGFGGNPEKDALYLPVTPEDLSGEGTYTLTVRDVPVDGFWSITVYDDTGGLVPNDDDAYAVNNLTAQKAGDGSVTVQFGGCDGRVPNCLPIVAGWNYLVRLYRPRPEVLDGTWTFPELHAVR